MVQTFTPPASIQLDHNTCGFCGHAIHAHVDCVSMVIPLVQRCTCEAQLCDHVATDNAYRSPEPWAVLDYFADSNGYNATSISSSNDPYGPSSMFCPADADSTITFSSDANVMPIPTAPVSSPHSRRELSPSRDARNIPLIPLTSTPIPLHLSVAHRPVLIPITTPEAGAWSGPLA
ncbi:hypothetical protein EDD85DRAFT_225987 [Armillaria nabsnona]|nr:hypothetical protein EDD85DRAFT_225987 [Armillaria nabsnona]